MKHTILTFQSEVHFKCFAFISNNIRIYSKTLPPPISEKLESNKARKRLRMTRFPTNTVAMKYGIQAFPLTKIQSHIDSIHSPQSTRNTIMKLERKFFFFEILKLLYFCSDYDTIFDDFIIFLDTNLCIKSVKFHLGMAHPSQKQTLLS